jgi:hypothetical protein
MKNILIFLALFIFISCHKNKTEEIQNGCIEQVLKDNGMVRYNGEDIGCHFFLVLLKANGNQYFQMDCHCADMRVYPFDCNGNIANTVDADFRQIIGIQK